MRILLGLIVMATLHAWSSSAHRAVAAQEVQSAKSRIAAVGLFKNGLAIVRREVTLSGPGTYRLEDVPEPVHGTFWVDCSAPVETAVRWRDHTEPMNPMIADIGDDLAGLAVRIRLRGDKDTSIVGQVPPRAQVPPETAVRPAGEPARGGRYLVVLSQRGRTMVDVAEIAAIEVEGGGAALPKKRRQATLQFTVAKAEPAPATLSVVYLTKGLAWAPSYRIDVSDPKKLVVEQGTVIKNELAELTDTDVTLITGFPAVQMGQVTSPLSPQTTWASFLAQLGRGEYEQMPAPAVQAAPMIARYGGNFAWAGQAAGAEPVDDGVDVHYQAIGKKTLAVGEALTTTVAKGQADYERIVEWGIPDTRDEYGNAVGRRSEDADLPDVPWDALKFKNPFAFPMTTGPALVVANQRFNGQRMLNWVNTNGEVLLRVNKALSVRALHGEQEVRGKDGDADREPIVIGGRRFRKVTVEGELTLGNHRKEPIRLVIRRRFSGELLQAEGDPKKSLREEGVYSVNRRNELTWTVSLPAGQEKKLAYRYAVLVAHDQRIGAGAVPAP